MVESLLSVVVQPRLFTVEECERIATLDLPWRQALVTGASEAPVTKQAEWKLVELDDASEWIFARLAKFLERHATYGFDLEKIQTPIKVQRYRPGGFHDWHVDLGNPKAKHRKLGLTVQLSDTDDYAGGDVRFFDPPDHAKAPRARGTAFCFPAYVPHEVTPVTRGQRLALTAWVVGPPFR